MKAKIAKEFVCPKCRTPELELLVKKRVGEEIEEGTLRCNKCNMSYDIIEGIPIMAKKEVSVLYELWDRVWKGIELNIRNIIKRTKPKELLNYFCLVDMIRKRGNVKRSLDIGCGSGSFSYVLSRFEVSEELYLMDISFESLRVAKRLFKNSKTPFHLVLGDASSIPFPDKHFDISFSTGLIEHFKNKEQKRVVSEHCRTAKKSVIQVPTNSISYWTMRAGITLKGLGWPFGYEKPVSSKRLSRLFKENGFTVRERGNHDLLTIFLYYLRPRLWLNIKKSIFSKLFGHEIIFYAE